MRYAMLALALACGGTAQQSSAPSLTPRNTPPPDATSLDARITAPVDIPREASGVYQFDRGRDTVEVDFTEDGLSGYMSVAEIDRDDAVPVTLFFERTTVGGSHLYFLTHEVHRTRFEFDGDMRQGPVQGRSLLAVFSLAGTLTTHRIQADGSERTEQRKVTLKSASLR